MTRTRFIHRSRRASRPPMPFRGGALAVAALLAALAAFPAESAQPRDEKGQRDIVVANVGEQSLTLARLRRLIQPRLQLEIERRAIDRDKDPESFRQVRRLIEEQVVGEWLFTTALTHEARALGLEVTDAELQVAIDRLSMSLDGDGNKRSIVKLAEESGLEVEDFKTTLREAMLGDKFVRKWIEENVKEEQLKEMYEQDPGRYVLSPRRRLIHYIALMRESGVDPDEQYDKMRDAHRKARRGGDFEELAREVGMKPGVPVERWVTPADRFPDRRLDEAIFEVEPGQVSDIIRTRYGLHFFKVVEDREAVGTTFERCRPVVVETLIESTRPELAKAILKRLKSAVFVNQRYLTPVGDESIKAGGEPTEEQIMNAIIRDRTRRRLEGDTPEDAERKVIKVRTGQ